MSRYFENRRRILVTQEAARIIVDEGVKDYQSAKRKAAARLGVVEKGNLPRNKEIEQAVLDHHRLFHADTQPQQLQELRQAALTVMRLLRDFRPRLVGAVLSGTAGRHAEVNLHLFADAAEEVLFRLMDRGIDYDSLERRLRYAEKNVVYPAVRFAVEGAEVEALILPLKGLRQPPLSPVDGKPMARADVDEVTRLLDDDASTQRHGETSL